MHTKILIIEDDPYISRMYVEQLEKEGFEVDVAQDGEEGLNKAKEKPDLILLDVTLPKLSGFEVLKRLKANEKLKSIPVIMLTNVAEVKKVKKALELGACDYLVKGYTLPKKVIEKVRKAVMR
ncbi:response regulator [candidate division WOR-3 bacterium]|nr:response regulator [candidate division WOR-3 bacterium]